MMMMPMTKRMSPTKYQRGTNGFHAKKHRCKEGPSHPQQILDTWLSIQDGPDVACPYRAERADVRIVRKRDGRVSMWRKAELRQPSSCCHSRLKKPCLSNSLLQFDDHAIRTRKAIEVTAGRMNAIAAFFDLAVDIFIGMFGVVMEQAQPFDAGFHGEVNGIHIGGVTPTSLAGVFDFGILSVMKQKVSSTAFVYEHVAGRTLCMMEPYFIVGQEHKCLSIFDGPHSVPARWITAAKDEAQDLPHPEG